MCSISCRALALGPHLVVGKDVLPILVGCVKVSQWRSTMQTTGRMTRSISGYKIWLSKKYCRRTMIGPPMFRAIVVYTFADACGCALTGLKDQHRHCYDIMDEMTHASLPRAESVSTSYRDNLSLDCPLMWLESQTPTSATRSCSSANCASASGGGSSPSCGCGCGSS